MTDAERLADGQLDQIERALVSHENSLRNNPIFPWRSDIREFLIAEHRETLKIARALQSELAEAKMAYSNVLGRNLPLAAEKVQAQEERDAALAEVERWKDDYDEEARACEENARETQEARAEAEALRAALKAWKARVIDANRSAMPGDFAWGTGIIKEINECLARLSPPAPAQDVQDAELGVEMSPWSLDTQPAPETAKCPNLPGHETHSPPCGLDYSILDPKHGATARPPAAASAPCRWGTSGVYCLEHGDWRKRGDERCPSAPGGRKE